MNTCLMFSIIVVLFGELWICSATSVRKNGPVYPKESEENLLENEDDQKRDLSNSAEEPNIEITHVVDWPSKKIKFGQVTSVSIDSRGNIYAFHRGDRSWDTNTFYMNNNTFRNIDAGPISIPTVAVIHPKSGALLYEWGSNLFYLPHGITTDKDNNVWITDVALHQVFKFPPIYPASANNTVPLLTLGTPFVYGNNLSLFCKPTDVAVLPNGDFFVSDGYCNSRIIKYSSDGKIILHWGRSSLEMGSASVPPLHFSIPHDLTLMEDKNEVCVSDRENGRLQCFLTLSGNFTRELKLREVGTRLFAATYTPAGGGLFFMVNTPLVAFIENSHGSVVDAESEKFLKAFQPQGTTLQTPHDIIVSANATEVYVTELNPAKLWKFKVTLSGDTITKSNENQIPFLAQDNEPISDSKSSGTMVMAMIITAAVLCFGAALLIAALIYSRARTRGRSLSLEDIMLEPTLIHTR